MTTSEAACLPAAFLFIQLVKFELLPAGGDGLDNIAFLFYLPRRNCYQGALAMQIRIVRNLPGFPQNKLGLQRGTIIRALDRAVEQLGMKVGDEIPLGFDGESIRCADWTWNIEQIVREIETGVWKIVGSTDLSTPEASAEFAAEIEYLKVESVH